MDISLEHRKYQLIEQLIRLSDKNIIAEIENIIHSEQANGLSKKEMIHRASIAEKQLDEGLVKSHQEAKERLSKWIK